MANDHFILPIHYKELLISTQEWTDEEFGCYVRLLISQWDKGKISDNIKRLIMIAESVERNKDLVLSKFEKIEGGLQNEKMELIRLEKNNFQLKQSNNGKKGGNPNFKHGEHNPYYKPKDNPEHYPKDKPSPSPSPSPSSSSQPNPSSSDIILLRKTKFKESLEPFLEKYGKETLNEFYKYWVEMNDGGKKMRFEMEKVFELKKRLARWQKNNFNKNGSGNAAQDRIDKIANW